MWWGAKVDKHQVSAQLHHPHHPHHPSKTLPNIPPFLFRFSSRSPEQRSNSYSSYRNLSHLIMLFLQICHISQYSDVPYFLCLFRVSQETGKYLIHLAGSHIERHKTHTRIFLVKLTGVEEGKEGKKSAIYI